jgi:methyl-accepting chemotaxis protein
MSFLSGFKFRIGTKLGLSAGIGVLLVTGMVVNQQWSGSSIADGSNFVGKQTKIMSDVIEAKASMRGMQLGVRDIRLAQTPEQVKAAVEYLAARDKAAAQFVDDSLTLVTKPENRERLTKVKGLIGDYFSAGNEIAKIAEKIHELEAARNNDAVAWGKTFNVVLTSPVLAGLSNRREIELALREVDSLFLQTRNASWRFVATGDASAKETTKQSGDKALAKLKETRALVMDASLMSSFDELSKDLSAFKASVDQGIALEDQKAQVVRERGLPAAAAAEATLNETVETVKKLTANATSDSEATIAQTGRVGLGAGLVVVLLLIGSAVFSVFNIARPIAKIGTVLLELANGNKAVDIPYAERGDEVGDNARAAKTFKDNLLRIEKMEAEQKEVEARSAVQRKADMHKLANDFQSAVGNIIDTVSSASTELEATAGTLTKTAQTTQNLSTTVAAASEEASANVNSVASASEELAGSVNEIARQVQESSKIAAEAVKQAEKTDTRIAELSQAANRIGDVVKLITGVAEQTNLLALNATIEAARAGEAGRGFAVVASEVKALAGQTAKATEEISTQIAGMQSATQDAVTAIKEIGGTIGRISEISAAIAAAVEEQGAATQEISRNVQQAAQGTAQVATNITDVNRGAGETGSASSQVLSSAQQLSQESNHLKTEVDKFLTTVRAA